jgi:hypothetical protein
MTRLPLGRRSANRLPCFSLEEVHASSAPAPRVPMTPRGISAR